MKKTPNFKMAMLASEILAFKVDKLVKAGTGGVVKQRFPAGTTKTVRNVLTDLGYDTQRLVKAGELNVFIPRQGLVRE